MNDVNDLFSKDKDIAERRGRSVLLSVVLGVIFWVLLEATEIKFFLYPTLLFMGFWFTWVICGLLYTFTGKRALSWIISAIIIYGGFALLLIFGK